MKRKTTRIISVLLVAIIIFSFGACTKKKTANKNEKETTTAESTTAPTEEETTVPADESAQGEQTAASAQNEKDTAKTAALNNATKKQTANATKAAANTTVAPGTEAPRVEQGHPVPAPTEAPPQPALDPAKVCAEVNAYAAKFTTTNPNRYGQPIEIDTSRRPNNTSWSLQISPTQPNLIEFLKRNVDEEINNANASLINCYFDGTDYYVLYL